MKGRMKISKDRGQDINGCLCISQEELKPNVVLLQNKFFHLFIQLKWIWTQKTKS